MSGIGFFLEYRIIEWIKINNWKYKNGDCYYDLSREMFVNLIYIYL